MILKYKNKDFTVLYVDAGTTSAGAGETVAGPLADLPDLTTLTTDTAFIIRRHEDNTGVTHPGTNPPSGISTLFIGCPRVNEPLFEQMENDVKGQWCFDTAEYTAWYKDTNYRVYFDEYPDLLFYNIKFLCLGDFGTEYFHMSARTDNTSNLTFQQCMTTSYPLGRMSDQTEEFASGNYPGLCYSDGYYWDHLGHDVCIMDSEFDHAKHLFNVRYREGADRLTHSNNIYNSASGAYVSYGYNSHYAYSNEYEIEGLFVYNAIQNIYVNGDSSSNASNFITYLVYDYYYFGTGSRFRSRNLIIKNLNINMDAPVIGTCTKLLKAGLMLNYKPATVIMEDVSVDYSRCWIPSGFQDIGQGIAIWRWWFGDERVDDDNSYAKNITFKLADTSGGLGDKPTSRVVHDDNFRANMVYLYRMKVDNFTVIAPRNLGIRLSSCQVNNLYAKTMLNVDHSTINCTFHGTDFPDRTLRAINKSRVYIDTIDNNKTNPDNIYIGDPAVYSDTIDGSNIFVNQTNVPLFGSNLINGGDSARSLLISYNDLTQGNFRARSNNHILETWSVQRGGNAVLKFSQYDPAADWFELGYEPFRGLFSTPSTIGKQTMEVFIAFKNYFDMDAFHKELAIEIRIPTSDTDDFYKTLYVDNGTIPLVNDSDSVYTNDSDLTQLKWQIPIDIVTINKPIQLIFKCRAYSSNGYIYFDPKPVYL